jgi:tRNA threonylcarbamoyladenosine biosynthesis protein TsaB
LESVLARSNLSPRQIDCIAVNQGPGSFTSLRLGFSLAKGLSLSTGCPIYAVPAMEVYAFPFAGFKAAVIPGVDAKRGKFYAGVFRKGKEVTPAGDYSPKEIVSFVDAEEPVLLAGPDAGLLKEKMLEHNPLATLFTVDSPVQASRALFELALEQKKAGTPPLGETDGPLYIRLSEAEEGAADAHT